MQGTIGVAFVDTKKQKQQLEEQNRKGESDGCLVGLITALFFGRPKYCHCEMLFQNDDPTADPETCVAFGVYKDKGVYREKRDFSNPAYNKLYFRIPQDKVNKAFLFCCNQVGKGFDHCGATMMPIWSGKEPNGKRWWGGTFVLTALHEAGLLQEYRAGPHTIDEIVYALKKQPNIVNDMDPFELRMLKGNMEE